MNQNKFRYFLYLLGFLACNPCKILRNKSEKFKLFFSRIFGTSQNHAKNIFRWSGATMCLSLNYFFVKCWHLLKSCKKHFPMVRGDLFFEKFNFFADCWNHLESCKNHFPMVRGVFVLRSFNYFSVQLWHLLKSSKNHFPMVKDFFC